MRNATFGWPALNHALQAVSLSAGSSSGDLAPTQLQNNHGDPSTAWQTAAGALTPDTGAWVQCSAAGRRRWGLVGVARTNLTPDARIRWRIGGPTCLDPRQVLPSDTAAGATSGPATTRTGSVAGPSGAGGTAYTNGAGSAYVRPGAYPVQAGYTHEVAVWFRWISGATTAGSLIIAEYLDESGATVRNARPMSAVSPGSDWQLHVHRWVPGRDGGTTIYLVADTGAMQFELGPVLYGQVPEFDSGMDPAGVAPGYGQSILVMPEAVHGQLCRLDISDPSNAQGFINIPLLYAGDSWTPALNIDWESAPGNDAEVVEVVTRGGQEYPTLRYERRRWEISHQALSSQEIWRNVSEMMRSARTGGNVLFVPEPDGEDINREAVFGRLHSTADYTYPLQAREHRAWRGQITERL